MHIPDIAKYVVSNRLILFVIQLRVTNANEALQVVSLAFVEQIAEYFSDLAQR